MLPFGAFSHLRWLLESHPLRPQYLQHILMAIQGILSGVALPECLGERTGKSKQQSLGWLTFQHRRAFQCPRRLTGRTDSSAAAGRPAGLCSITLTQVCWETAASAVTAQMTHEPWVAAGQSLLAGTRGRCLSAFFSCWNLASPPLSPC